MLALECLEKPALSYVYNRGPTEKKKNKEEVSEELFRVLDRK
jgi:hypothetical protein